MFPAASSELSWRRAGCPPWTQRLHRGGHCILALQWSGDNPARCACVMGIAKEHFCPQHSPGGPWPTKPQGYSEVRGCHPACDTPNLSLGLPQEDPSYSPVSWPPARETPSTGAKVDWRGCCKYLSEAPGHSSGQPVSCQGPGDSGVQRWAGAGPSHCVSCSGWARGLPEGGLNSSAPAADVTHRWRNETTGQTESSFPSPVHPQVLYPWSPPLRCTRELQLLSQGPDGFPCPCASGKEGHHATVPLCHHATVPLSARAGWRRGRSCCKAASCHRCCGWRGSCHGCAGSVLARPAHRSTGRLSVPCDVPGSPGRRWNGAGLQLQGRLLVDPEQAGSSLGAGGDVFSSLKFDFHDLFLLLAATPSTGSGFAFPAKELN